MRLPPLKGIKKLRKKEAVIVEKIINGDAYKAEIFVTDYIKSVEGVDYDIGKNYYFEYLTTDYDYIGNIYKNGNLIEDSLSLNPIYDELILEAENNSDDPIDTIIEE